MFDVLGDILRSVRLRATIFSRAHFGERWAVRAPATDVGVFHGVSRGECWLIPEEGEAQHLAAGSVVLLPSGQGHVLCDDPRTTAVPLESLHGDRDEAGIGLINAGGDNPKTSIICGRMEFDRGALQALSSRLPPLIRVDSGDDPLGGWLAATVRLLGEELSSNQPGHEVVVTRLADVVVVQALRRFVQTHRDHASGWLGGLRDDAVARALACIHREPARRWTAESLATSVGLSRSVLFSRFSAAVGEPPARYLTRWRMHLAAQALRYDPDSITTIAARVGYSSDTAFSKAFRDFAGVPPGAFRRA